MFITYTDIGLFQSYDAGVSWTGAPLGIPSTWRTRLTSPVGKLTLYACGFGRGVYKSIDNGKTWTLKNNGIEKKQPFAWRLTRAEDGTLYLVVARRSERGRSGDDDDGALYKSSDGGEHWLKMNLPAGTNGPMSLVLDPSTKGRMYLSAWGVARLTGDTGGGVFLSTEAGRPGRVFLVSHNVVLDPVDQKSIYITTFGGSVWHGPATGDATSKEDILTPLN